MYNTISVGQTVSVTDEKPLSPRRRLDLPSPLRIAFPVLLEGDMHNSPEHLGVGYLVAVLRSAGASCRVVEVADEGEAEPRARAIANWRPHIVSLTLTTLTAALAVSFGRTLRGHIGNRTLVVAGGPLATHRAGELLLLQGWEFLDLVVRG